MANGIVLCSTLHDPKAGLLGTFSDSAKVVRENGFNSWIINVTSSTDLRIKQELRGLSEFGVILIETQADREHRLAENVITDDHFRAVQKAVEVAKEKGISRIVYCDGDRINMGAREYPKDFKEMSRELDKSIESKGTYVNVRRSRKDHLDHQTPLWATETVFNRAYSEAFGMPIDIGSTMHGMSLDVATKIYEEGPKMGVEYPHPPFILVAKESGARIKSLEIPNILSSETPEQCRPDVEKDFGRTFSDYPELQKAWKATSGLTELHSKVAWDRRFKLEEQYLRVLAEHLINFGLPAEKEGEVRQVIEKALVGMELRRSRVEKFVKDSEGKLINRQEKARGLILDNEAAGGRGKEIQ